MPSPRFLTKHYLIGIAILGAFCAGLVHPTYFWAITMRMFAYIICIACTIAACATDSPVRFRSYIIFFVSVALWHQFLGQSSWPLYLSDSLLSLLGTSLSTEENAHGESYTYLSSIVEIQTALLVSCAVTTISVCFLRLPQQTVEETRRGICINKNYEHGLR